MANTIFPDNQKLATVAEVAAAVTLSVATIHRKVKAGEFPSPIKMGSRCTRFSSTDDIAWLESKRQEKAPNDTQGG